MKKNLFMTLAAAALLLCSCSEDLQVRNIKGGYHYKTAGQVTITQQGYSPYQQVLENESGVMEVVSLYNADSLLITLNQTNGGVFNTKGRTDGQTLRFEPFDRTIKLLVENNQSDTIKLPGIGILAKDTIITHTTHEAEVFDIRVNGRGEVYENNIILYLTYDGQSQTSSKTLHGTDIQMLAKKNER